MSDTPPSCFFYLNKLKQKVNEHSDEYSNETEIDQAVHQLRILINSMKLDEKQTKEIEDIINSFQAAAHKLLDEIGNIQCDIKNIKKDKQEVQQQLDDLKKDNNRLQDQFYDLKKEIRELKTNSSDKVLKETYAHLLKPLIKQIDEEFQTKKNEETKNTSSPTSYNFINNYNKNVLKDIKSGTKINDGATKLINNIINKFSNEAKLSKNEVLELLINTTKRNYTAHSCIDDFICDLINNEYTTNDFIQYIEDENGITLCISNKDKETLMKLLQYNIIHRPKQSIVTDH